jgi:hypothetical protein
MFSLISVDLFRLMYSLDSSQLMQGFMYHYHSEICNLKLEAVLSFFFNKNMLGIKYIYKKLQTYAAVTDK